MKEIKPEDIWNDEKMERIKNSMTAYKSQCDKCKHRVVMHAFSKSTCLECKVEISTSHIPSDKYCQDCADKLNKCKSCGENKNK